MARAVQPIDALIEATLARARVSPRLRANHNLHGDLRDNPDRFLNAWLRGTYTAPHRQPGEGDPAALAYLEQLMLRPARA